jgi:hypothetical protein
LRAGADEVLLTAGNMVERIRALAPDGVHHVVEVAFEANIKTDSEILAQGGSIATYATNATPEIPFWQLVFMNTRIFFVGSDDVPTDAKIEATRDINQALEAGWQGLDIAARFPLEDIARVRRTPSNPRRLRQASRPKKPAMPKRNLRVVKWVGTVPAIGVCTFCNRTFKVPLGSNRVADVQESLRVQFTEHKCKREDASQAAARIVKEAAEDK